MKSSAPTGKEAAAQLLLQVPTIRVHPREAAFPGAHLFPAVNCSEHMVRMWSVTMWGGKSSIATFRKSSGRALFHCILSNALPTNLSVCGHWAGMCMCVAYLQSQPVPASRGVLVQRRKYWMTLCVGVEGKEESAEIWEWRRPVTSF